jgi:16S rRNA (cytosine967-C5)-methyltransferase
VSRFHSYLNSAKEILSLYQGQEPFASFAKKYFSERKKIGSKDRKQITGLCYSFFRTGKLTEGLPDKEKLLVGLFLCSNEPVEILHHLKPEWNEKTGLPVKQKLSLLNYHSSAVFPWKEELSDGIEYEKFCESFFIQPDLFLRIRPGNAEQVLLKLNNIPASYEFISPFNIRLPNNFKAEGHFELNKEVVVQDYSSQRVMEVLPVRPDGEDKVWDCCAGSGGKSIMAYDLNPKIQLTVSDVRESILANLKKRFKDAGIKKYNAFTGDMTKPDINLSESGFDLAICDVPCSGSGTWGRTPEQLYYFDAKKITRYAALQQRIVSNAVKQLKPGGHLLYITCSVFKKENEMMADFMKQELHLVPEKKEMLKGYDRKADTMFVALLRKPL